MEHLGISINIHNRPVLDPGFIPLHAFNQAFLKTATKPLAIAIEGSGGQVSVLETRIHGTPERAGADAYHAERLVKTLLWQKGGCKVMICGDRSICETIARAYSPQGTRSFDYHFMARVYERPFEVISLDYEQKPTGSSQARPVGRHLDGCRIGFDAGGSDRKVSAVIDGEPVFSEEVVWLPKEQADPDYHYTGIVAAFRTAAAHMPRVDAIGISSAGIYIDNRTMVASLFLKVPDNLFEAKVKDIYIRAAQEIGPDIPVEVCNDGDVSALAGAMSLDSGSVLGLAMGTSEAGGYVDHDGNITGWLNELAFVPVDASSDAMVDEWSGDIGCGVKYFSQDGIIKLAPRAGIDLSAAATPAEKLKIVQKLMAAGDPRAAAVFASTGCYLGHALAWYNHLYTIKLAPRAGIDLSAAATPAEKLKIVQKLMAAGDPRAAAVFASTGCYLGHALAWYNHLYTIKHVLLLGRVMSGRGGDLILAEAKRVLAEEYPEVRLIPSLPDEKFRRIGQSVAAASLPDITKRG